jgi:hypothetical protein
MSVSRFINATPAVHTGKVKKQLATFIQSSSPTLSKELGSVILTAKPLSTAYLKIYIHFFLAEIVTRQVLKL